MVQVTPNLTIDILKNKFMVLAYILCVSTLIVFFFDNSISSPIPAHKIPELSTFFILGCAFATFQHDRLNSWKTVLLTYFGANSLVFMFTSASHIGQGLAFLLAGCLFLGPFPFGFFITKLAKDSMESFPIKEVALMYVPLLGAFLPADTMFKGNPTPLWHRVLCTLENTVLYFVVGIAYGYVFSSYILVVHAFALVSFPFSGVVEYKLMNRWRFFARLFSFGLLEDNPYSSLEFKWAMYHAFWFFVVGSLLGVLVA